MANTRIAEVRTGLATVLSDAGHTVYKYGADPDHTGRTYVVVGTIRSEQEPLAFGNVRQEDLEVELLIVHKAGGRSDTRAAAGETVVLDIVDDIENDLRGDITINGNVFNAEPSAALELEVGADEDGWVFLGRMTVAIEAHI